MKIYPAPRLTKRHSGQPIYPTPILGTGYLGFPLAKTPREKL